MIGQGLPDVQRAQRDLLAESKTRLSHDNGTSWRAVLLAGHARAVQPFRMDSGLACGSRAAVRCYRKPAWGTEEVRMPAGDRPGSPWAG